MKIPARLVTACLAATLAACSKSAGYAVAPTATIDDVAAGGTQTVNLAGSTAFGSPFPSLTGANLQKHKDGDADFERHFVTADGLGPLFINPNCTACHVNDGRGAVPLDDPSSVQMLFRLSQAGQDAHGGPLPVAGFGDQLQTRGIIGTTPEGSLSISYVEAMKKLADGTSVSLRQPSYAVATPYMALPAGLLLSARVAPPVFGLGLLEAVNEADIVANADENDANGDGISGRPNYVWDVANQTTVLGRFGWKANQPTIRQQVGAAYNGDMGITTSLFPLEPAAGQSQAGNQPPAAGASFDLPDTEFESVAFYVRTLAVPARRNVKDAQVLAGKALFVSAKCASCHLPVLRTSATPGLPAETANQTIAPYTDLLLHDMGPALADNRPDFRATGQEWRTPPLWGLGLSEVVNGHSSFLHDGRARGMLEAILWHGGEAQQSADAVSQMSAPDRAALLAFMKSL